MSEASPQRLSERERRLEEVLAALLAAEDAGQAAMREVLLKENADLADELRAFFGAHDRVRVLAAPLRAAADASSAGAETPQRDVQSTLCESPRPAGPSSVTTEPFPATTELPSGCPDDAGADAPTTPNGTGERDPIEFGARVRYFGDYELLNLLGRGGMGVVYRARQISLNRPVALKMLQAGVLASEDDLRRFQNEAEAVATLDHPHIVPILEVGQYEEQRYFSMKLIGGPSLDRKLGEFIGDPKAAARVVRTAAEAVHHAHVRGILHRDLKPANVLLDERGEPHLTDFGLAKRVQVESDLTQSGAILGTPPYMAPEQASGKRGMITTAADVYGLGAILYAVLTGRAPFAGESPLDTLEQVRERVPDPPSKHNPRIPRDLEVICLKCLEKQPERRYTSAQALAEDLRRYLNSEAILARPVGLATRAWMWCARNPALTRLGLALFLALFLATICTLGAVVIEGARRSETIARLEAETNLRNAQSAIDNYLLTNVSVNTLLSFQDKADAGSLRNEKGAAIRAFLDVREICEAIKNDLTGRPKPLWLLSLLAISQYNIGVIHKQNGVTQEALRFFEQSLASEAALADSHPSVMRFRENIAEIHREIADLHHAAHDDPKALQWITKAIDVYDSLVRAHPEQANNHNWLAYCWNDLGWFHDEARNNADAIKPFQNAVREQQLAVDKAENGEIYKSDLCRYLENLGEQYIDFGRPTEGLPWYKQALEIRRKLNAAHPENRTYSLNLVQALKTAGTIWRHDGDPSSARLFFTEARQVVDRWLGTASGDHDYKVQRAVLLVNEASTFADENYLEKAKSVLEEATALFRQLAGDGDVEWEWHSEALWDFARVLRALELTADADLVEAERSDLWKVRPPEELVALALKHASRANLIGYGKTPVSPQAKAVRELDLDQAADEVKLAIERGFKDLGMLKSHQDSGTLLSREDLAHALEDLAFPRNPFSDRR
jgi:tetratricopeptide (TPR) repeat protein